MSTRRDFLKQLGLLSAAVGTGLSLPPLEGPSVDPWSGLPIPLLTEGQIQAVLQRMQAPVFLNPDVYLTRPSVQVLPEGVRFVRRKEDAWGDRFGIGLRVERRGHRIKHALAWENVDLQDIHAEQERLEQAVRCLVEWYDRDGRFCLPLPECRV